MLHTNSTFLILNEGGGTTGSDKDPKDDRSLEPDRPRG